MKAWLCLRSSVLKGSSNCFNVSASSMMMKRAETVVGQPADFGCEKNLPEPATPAHHNRMPLLVLHQTKALKSVLLVSTSLMCDEHVSAESE